MVCWELKYYPNFDDHLTCLRCFLTFCSMRYIVARRNDGQNMIFSFDKLSVVNVRVENDNICECHCGFYIGVLEGNLVHIHTYFPLIGYSINFEDEEGLSNEFTPFMDEDDVTDLLFGCPDCQRPIGYGVQFELDSNDYIDVDLIHLVNANYDIVDMDLVICRCGFSLGDRTANGHIIFDLAPVHLDEY